MMINFDGTNFNSLVAYCYRYSKKWLKHLYPNFGARDEIPTSKQYERSKSNKHKSHDNSNFTQNNQRMYNSIQLTT